MAVVSPTPLNYEAARKRPLLRRASPLPTNIASLKIADNSDDEEAPAPVLSFAAKVLLGSGQDRHKSPPQRVVRLSNGITSASKDSERLRRARSVGTFNNNSPITPSKEPYSFKTPGQSVSGRNSPVLRSTAQSGAGSGLHEVSSITKGDKSQDDSNLATTAKSSLRITRTGGQLMRGRPRRGVIRRQSEESPIHDDNVGPDLHHDTPEDAFEHGVENEASQHVRFARKSQQFEIDRAELHRSPPLQQKSPIPRSSSSLHKQYPLFKVPPLPELPSRHDQENDPPPTFKRNKTNGLDILTAAREPMQSKISVMQDKVPSTTPGTVSPSRKPLAPRSQNTPLRPAPPAPPKMSVLDAATSVAGASATTNAKKKTNYVSINGKLFTRLDRIGRGGSGYVYRVMAENFKVFAFKRVSLEDADEVAIRGFKGEITLLQKLANVERVVKLYDYEINDKKQTLSMLMEFGEIDLNRLLAPYLDEDTGKFDITFTRFIWREMLECVEAVHAYDIVHSDLKPANFVVVRGRLKLIDFGIANAIADDTVNVHRETQIGTPNYMAPEALLDYNAQNGRQALGKLMKLGKASDIWSLGCILYQIVYRKPPFAHLNGHMQKIVAITNPQHAIDIPVIGHGHMPVPESLRRIIGECLDRDQYRRPTLDRLMARDNAFLHPENASVAVGGHRVSVNMELLGRIQASIVAQIRQRGSVPTDADMARWPEALFKSIQRETEGRA